MYVCFPTCRSVHVRWQRAVGLALHNTDPWASRRIHKLPMEVVTRYRYTASTRTWVKDDGECMPASNGPYPLVLLFLLFCQPYSGPWSGFEDMCGHNT